ncbi:hypothetical protein GE09DRAFT_576746 [Coniochaeta sp. 2T2.1]|nr:hypothetical protein GE09DRAFT_576746 [Coniochaeta sp. 2T2.1]
MPHQPTPCQHCPPLDVWTWSKGTREWQQDSTTMDAVVGFAHAPATSSRNPDLLLVCGHAASVRSCKRCLSIVSEAFAIPSLWWARYCRNANGYFGWEENVDGEANVTGISTWSCYLVKKLEEQSDAYEWLKIDFVSRWIARTKQTAIIVFDAPPLLVERLPTLLVDGLGCWELGHPFWVHARLLREIAILQDQAVWTIRDKVRETERTRTSEHKPAPNYRHLHDLARHAIHVSETLALAVMAAGSISQQHLEITGGTADTDEHSRRAAKRIGNRIVFYEHMLRALQCRAASNKERLMNEISLAFNTVAQYDSGISVNIGRAAQVDSAAMKTVAFLTLTFLPATFICAIFSMSFFNYDPVVDSWTVSRKFWIYWAVAIPTTFVTALLWHYWHTVFPPALIGEASEIDQKAHAIREKETSNHHGSSLLEDLA